MRTACLLLALAAVLAPHPTRADTPQQAQKAIQAVCDRVAAADVRNDLAGMTAWLAPSFVFTNIRGRQANFVQSQASAAQDIAQHRTGGSPHFTVGPVTLHGGVAQTTLTTRVFTKYPRTSKSAAYTYSREFTSQTTWVKGPKGWQQTSAQMVRDVTTYSRSPTP